MAEPFSHLNLQNILFIIALHVYQKETCGRVSVNVPCVRIKLKSLFLLSNYSVLSKNFFLSGFSDLRQKIEFVFVHNYNAGMTYFVPKGA